MLCTFCPPTILGDVYRIPEKSPKSSVDTIYIEHARPKIRPLKRLELGAEKAHKKKSHKISEKNPWMAGCPWDTRPASRQISVCFSIAINRKSLGHRPADPRLSRRVSQGHPAGVPGIFLSLCALFFLDRTLHFKSA